jgi:cell division protein FtsL
MALPLTTPSTGRSTSRPGTRSSTTPSTRPTTRPTKRAGATPQLTLVPGRRRFAWFAVALTVLVSAVMMGALFVHTRIAERQLDIDSLERSVRAAQEEFDLLRSERAELRSPNRLRAEATALGMQVGEESEFVAVDPMVLAVTIARTGHAPIDDEIVVGIDQQLEPLDQFRLVKEVTAESP